LAWRNSESEWGGVSKLFHWTMALLIVGSSIFVLHVNDSTPWFKSSPQVFITYIHWHKALGLIALALVVGRLLWRRRNPIPRTAPLTPFETVWSHRTHVALYTLMIAVPITGWLASSFFGSPTKFFGLFTIPAITPKWKPGVAIFYWVHFVLAWTILSVVAVHAAAALYHHFHRKDDVLRAMWFGARRKGGA
jgi:cytochrome b561